MRTASLLMRIPESQPSKISMPNRNCGHGIKNWNSTFFRLCPRPTTPRGTTSLPHAPPRRTHACSGALLLGELSPSRRAPPYSTRRTCRRSGGTCRASGASSKAIYSFVTSPQPITLSSILSCQQFKQHTIPTSYLPPSAIPLLFRRRRPCLPTHYPQLRPVLCLRPAMSRRHLPDNSASVLPAALAAGSDVAICAPGFCVFPSWPSVVRTVARPHREDPPPPHDHLRRTPPRPVRPVDLHCGTRHSLPRRLTGNVVRHGRTTVGVAHHDLLRAARVRPRQNHAAGSKASWPSCDGFRTR